MYGWYNYTMTNWIRLTAIFCYCMSVNVLLQLRGFTVFSSTQPNLSMRVCGWPQCYRPSGQIWNGFSRKYITKFWMAGTAVVHRIVICLGRSEESLPPNLVPDISVMIVRSSFFRLNLDTDIATAIKPSSWWWDEKSLYKIK